jgi:hypothetical protein
MWNGGYLLIVFCDWGRILQGIEYLWRILNTYRFQYIPIPRNKLRKRLVLVVLKLIKYVLETRYFDKLLLSSTLLGAATNNW